MYAHEPGKIPVSPDTYFPSKVSRNLRYVQSQNIPEPGGTFTRPFPSPALAVGKGSGSRD